MAEAAENLAEVDEKLGESHHMPQQEINVRHITLRGAVWILETTSVEQVLSFCFGRRCVQDSTSKLRSPNTKNRIGMGENTSNYFVIYGRFVMPGDQDVIRTGRE